jgi:spoIIIJ-associated protein
MTPKPQDFYGKEVADAIQQACDILQVPQEQLEIEVVETGSTGIFGLIRKKAHIKASVKDVEPLHEKKEDIAEVKKASPKSTSRKPKKKPAKEEKKVERIAEIAESRVDQVSVQPESPGDSDFEIEDLEDDDQDLPGDTGKEPESEELSAEVFELVRHELAQMLELMGYPSTVEVTAKGTSVLCHVGEEHEEILTGQDGKTLDSIQYLLRKIIVRKVPNRLRLTVDIGNYREKRLTNLKEQAAQLAENVKSDGKTQVIAALSPSERRVIHMSLQEDKEIRSRSVGDGLFKKILIYKPGKSGKGGGRKRNNSRGRKNNNSGNKKSD